MSILRWVKLRIYKWTCIHYMKLVEFLVKQLRKPKNIKIYLVSHESYKHRTSSHELNLFSSNKIMAYFNIFFIEHHGILVEL